MEDNQVYELFEELFQQLLVNKPDKPLDFLIEQLDKVPNPSKYKQKLLSFKISSTKCLPVIFSVFS